MKGEVWSLGRVWRELKLRGFEGRFRKCLNGWKRFWSEFTGTGEVGGDLGELRENEEFGVGGEVRSLENIWRRLEEGFGEVEGHWHWRGFRGACRGGKGLEREVGSFGKTWRG